MLAFRTGLVAAALVVPGLARAEVVINEFLPDPDGVDGGQEWVELYNSGAATVDLSGWTLRAGTSSLSDKYTLPAGTSLAPGGFLVIGEEDVTFADLNLLPGSRLSMGNAGSSGDAVALANAGGTVVDTLVYGPDNADGFLDDQGRVASPGPKPSSGRSLGRSPDGADTDDASADLTSMTPTPGATNVTVTPVTCDLVADAVGLVINELVSDAEGTDTGNEWVELYNGSGRSLDLSGYVLQAETSSFDGDGTVLPEATTLADGGYLLIAGEAIAGRDVELAGSIPNASSNADGVQLVDCEGAPVDTVVYGSPNEDGWRGDDGSVAESLAPKPGSGESLARAVDGLDTDRSGADFILQPPESVTPGARNPDPPPCDPDADIVINEFMADPDGSDTGLEWVELYNAGGGTITLAGWTLYTGTSSFSSGTLLQDLDIPAGGHVLIGQELVDGADQQMETSLGNGTSSSDGVQLVDCRGTVIDTVIYGSPNDGETPFLDDTGAIATSLAPTPRSGASLARIQDGYDTDASQADFTVESSPTPGATNPEREPVVCTPASGATVVLNEALVDADGEDTGREWIELFNPTGAPVRVDGWGVTAAGDVDDIGVVESRFPGGLSVPAGSFLVIGGGDVEGDVVDVVVPLDLSNGTGGDALILYDCEGTRIDSVLYGGDNEDLLTDDLGEVPEQAYVETSSAATLARVEDGVDTDAAIDWFTDGSPTPGTTNFQESGGGPQPGGGGCGNRDNDAPDAPTEPRGGCGRDELPPALAGLGILLGGLAGRRRRRRRS